MPATHRRKRLTASNFGKICKMLPTTGCGRIVKGLLYGAFENAATIYGKSNEDTAIEEVEKQMNIKIIKCGLFVDEKHKFLGASPDGIIEEEDGIVEIKCPYSSREKNPYEHLRINKKSRMLNPDDTEDKIISINKKHDRYYQIQGQLNITKKTFCLYAIWSPKGLIIEKIVRDEVFWQNSMEQYLIKFYNNCILPEILDPRQPRSMAIREPQYILEAQSKRKKKTPKTKKTKPTLHII